MTTTKSLQSLFCLFLLIQCTRTEAKRSISPQRELPVVTVVEPSDVSTASAVLCWRNGILNASSAVNRRFGSNCNKPSTSWMIPVLLSASSNAKNSYREREVSKNKNKLGVHPRAYSYLQRHGVPYKWPRVPRQVRISNTPISVKVFRSEFTRLNHRHGKHATKFLHKR